ncbi:SAM-dependent methyltransferase [Vibrio sp. 10N.286.49.B3]|uniref:methyltransferase n=1 Tax=Vibrio sp. 10N.286.49.B3 TaxID=1880855 RepID=UPI000C823050|nr:methyltransferase [Vibrio sp. 10N.286.49.B3]PMH46778.1 SAM-dependent methyltransferase [Vibrio sp. 10N.286.49.B3]
MRNTFTQLDSLLLAHQALWRFEPFHACFNRAYPWHSQFPQLTAWLESLCDDKVEHLKLHPEALTQEWLTLFPGFSIINDIVLLPSSRSHSLVLPRGLDTGIPGRKLAQIVSMSEVALYDHVGTEWLEWCAGKGFLGRILAQQSHQKVTSFEWQQALCDSGQEIADKQSIPMHFIQGDAFTPEAKAVFNPNQHAVALHACGDLHVRLLELSVYYQLPAITISPCCYHLINSEHYRPLSEQAQLSTLLFTRSELSIPLHETVTGGERVKRHRRLEMIYRLGLQLLLTEQYGAQSYIPIPSIKKSLLANGFQAFCHWASEKKQLGLVDCDWDYYANEGEKRFKQMERLSLVQQVYRRAIEIWLAMDKALYLQENGYQVEMSTFCQREVTPRNILIHAKK